MWRVCSRWTRSLTSKVWSKCKASELGAELPKSTELALTRLIIDLTIMTLSGKRAHSSRPWQRVFKALWARGRIITTSLREHYGHKKSSVSTSERSNLKIEFQNRKLEIRSWTCVRCQISPWHIGLCHLRRSCEEVHEFEACEACMSGCNSKITACLHSSVVHAVQKISENCTSHSMCTACGFWSRSQGWNPTFRIRAHSLQTTITLTMAAKTTSCIQSHPDASLATCCAALHFGLFLFGLARHARSGPYLTGSQTSTMTGKEHKACHHTYILYALARCISDACENQGVSKSATPVNCSKTTTNC